MALTDNGNSGNFVATMPMQPMYGGYGGGYGGGLFGGNGNDWMGILFLIALLNGGFGGWGMGMGGMGGLMGFGIDFPWLLNGQNNLQGQMNDGFRNAQLHDSVTSVRDGISALATQLCGCCGDMQMGLANSTAAIQQSLCNGFAGVNQGVASGFAGVNASINGAAQGISHQLYNNEIASLNRSFAEQTANTQGFNSVNSALADVKYTEATEACATRTASASNTRDIIDAQTRGTQAILDKLCQLELDGIKGQLAQAQRENVGLQNQLNMATFQASQVDQTAQFRANQATVANQLVSELRSCPIPSQPVYGNQPIFTCSGPQWNNSGCGCNGGNGFAA